VVGTDDEHEALGAGLHVLDDPYPLKRAGHLAARMRADLCATLPQVSAAIDARAGLPTLDGQGVDGLRALAARLAQAQRIVDSTQARAVEEVAERMAQTGSAVAVHPASIRDRAAAVVAARQRLATTEQALDDHHAAVAAAPVEPDTWSLELPDGPGPGVPTLDGEAGRASPPRGRAARAIGVIVLAFGLGLATLALDLAPLWAALIPTLLASLWALRYLQPHDGDADADDRAATTSLLREVAASTDEVFGARRATASLDQARARLAADRDQAQEALRVAERAWHDLAGPEVDVDDVEAVVRRFDPQHLDALTVAGETPSVRAATMLLGQLQVQWAAAWGGDQATVPSPSEAEAAVERAAELRSRPVVLVGPATERAQELAAAVPAAPVIVLDGPLDD
jgi:hypothetical protein